MVGRRAAPPGRSVSLYAIGDLHGCPEELEVLLDWIGPSSDDTLIFLGDYVDRGPGVRVLVNRLVELRSASVGTVFLRGNHEDMLLDYLGLTGGRHGELYLGTGGAETLRSYGVPTDTRGTAAATLLPPSHVQFLRALVTSFTHDRFLFVHAGVRPDVPLDEQTDEDMLWIRAPFFERPHQLPYTVVFGHTPSREARIDLPQSIGLDTGLVFGNKLTCLDVTAQRLIQVHRGDRHAHTQELTEAPRGVQA